ncbi:MAG: hypothetical protein JJ896_05120 [Rhodothermales bacterium]|nr:hypothetical protein [Rhodothermales bacterium]MBO6779014.1 hypothetical protein [Rhodothermales bacterium]
MKKTPVSDAKKALYDALLATHPDAERKGKNLLYTSVNGHMFTMFSTEARFGIRLSREDQTRFREQYESGPFTSYGSTMKDYVVVPEDLLERTEELAPWLAASYEFVTSLPPKPTKKKK